MKSRTICILAVAAMALLLGVQSTQADDHNDQRVFRARLVGAEETPAISTKATGEFRASVNSAGTELSYTLQYSGLEGGNTLFSHVHLGQAGVSGGVMFFLCGGSSKPACPIESATISGTVVAADVIGPTGQGITAGQFDEVIRAMKKGLAYANVHTTQFPTGEIRGQVNDESSDR